MDTTTPYDSIAKSPKTHTQQLSQDESYIAQSYTIEVGKLGRTVGLKGALIFHLMSDFAEFIQAGTMLAAHKPSRLLIVESIAKRHGSMLLTFEGVNSREKAQELVNARLFTSEQETRTKCPLKKDEFFYFDIIGLEVIEEGEVLGKVIDIERIGTTDYLLIEQNSQTQATIPSSPSKTTKKKSKVFYIPYIDTYVLTITLASPTQSGGVFTQNAKLLYG